jgi:hypothetical protein
MGGVEKDVGKRRRRLQTEISSDEGGDIEG